MLVISVATSVAAVLFVRFDIFGMAGAEVQAYDDGLTTMTRWRNKTVRSDKVILVALDNKTLQGIAANKSYALNFGRWPYSRNLWARVLQHLDAEGARAIVLDYVIDERHPDPSGDLAMGQVIAGLRAPVIAGFALDASSAVKKLPAVKATNRLRSLANASAKTASQPAVPKDDADETFPDSDDSGANKASSAADKRADDADESFPGGDGSEKTAGAESSDGYPTVTPAQVAQALAFPVSSGQLAIPRLLYENKHALNPQPPIAPLIDAVSGFGLVAMEEDDDGKIRRTRFAGTDGQNSYVSLAVATVADIYRAERVTIEPGRLRIGAHSVRINDDGTAEINYGGDLFERFASASMIDVLDDWAYMQERKTLSAAQLKAQGKSRRLPADFFKNKVVVLGGTATSVGDVKATPFSSNSPGVVKHAAEIQNLLDDQFIVRAPFWVSVLITFLIAFFSVAIIIILQNLVLEVLFPIALFFGFIVVTGWFLVEDQLHVLSAMPSWAASSASIFGALYNHFFASEYRQRLRRAFERSMEPVLCDQLVEQKKRRLPRLEGEFREATVLYTDIARFGQVAAQFNSDPTGLAEFLNKYHTRVTAVVMRHGGYIERYRVDTAVCLFGAPMAHTDHAVRACKAALAILSEVELLRGELPEEQTHWIDTRIGINSGQMFLGNFGSDQHPQYGAAGDQARRADLIERLNDKYHTRILVGQRTAELAGDRIILRQIDIASVMPDQPAEMLHEVTGEKGVATF